MAENKSMAQELLYAPQNGHVRIDTAEEAACAQYCEGYKRFGIGRGGGLSPL